MDRKIPQTQTYRWLLSAGIIKTGKPVMIFILNSTHIYERLSKFCENITQIKGTTTIRMYFRPYLVLNSNHLYTLYHITILLS
ncbi:protein of unknown function [Clostridium beijerinckii]|nr:protein of unknown function [Clostridium beijerinckii]